jgi:hypothetical protein
MLGFYIPFMFLANMAIVKGVSVENANFLIAVTGFSNSFGNF